jgi:hypothetical protein
MLPDVTIPGSLAGLLMAFRSCFTAPTFDTFNAMVVGLIAQTRRRTVCGILLGSAWSGGGITPGRTGSSPPPGGAPTNSA